MVGLSAVSVNFYARGPKKAPVTLTHGQLPSRKAAEQMKAFWKERLTQLRTLLEG